MNDIGLQMKNRDRLDREKLRRGYERLAASVSDENIVRLFGADDLEMADGAIRACLRYSLRILRIWKNGSTICAVPAELCIGR